MTQMGPRPVLVHLYTRQGTSGGAKEVRASERQSARARPPRVFDGPYI